MSGENGLYFVVAGEKIQALAGTFTMKLVAALQFSVCTFKNMCKELCTKTLTRLQILWLDLLLFTYAQLKTTTRNLVSFTTAAYDILIYFSEKIRFDISYELSVRQNILEMSDIFSQKNKCI